MGLERNPEVVVMNSFVFWEASLEMEVTSLRNICWLPTDPTTLCPRRQNSSEVTLN
jgi:hypothetical protein